MTYQIKIYIFIGTTAYYSRHEFQTSRKSGNDRAATVTIVSTPTVLESGPLGGKLCVKISRSQPLCKIRP